MTGSGFSGNRPCRRRVRRKKATPFRNVRNGVSFDHRGKNRIAKNRESVPGVPGSPAGKSGHPPSFSG
ncbi:MAG: hypothetical protein CW346_08685 [Bacillaceae bacterium]|nr:hypothetical protein [Bacillaceae bacterium]